MEADCLIFKKGEINKERERESERTEESKLITEIYEVETNKLYLTIQKDMLH